MNPQSHAAWLRPLSSLGADRTRYAWDGFSVRTETIHFHKGRGGPAER